MKTKWWKYLKKRIVVYSFRVLKYENLLERQISRNDVASVGRLSLPHPLKVWCLQKKKNNDALKCSDLIEIYR